MTITDVKIRKTFDEGPMKAVASVTFDNELALHDVKVIYAKEKYFVVMPSRKNPDGTYRDIVHPISSVMRETLEKAVVEAYFDALNAQTVATEEQN
ncbi:MAG: SpoVG family protein [Clostridia bacterium]|nr:SpoVG family protein [Clostridia bacterium]